MSAFIDKTLIFDIGRVLIQWDVYALYRKLLPNDAEIAHFLEEVQLLEHNLEFDRGAPFSEGIAELANRFPHRRDLLAVFDTRWEETVPGPIEGSVAILEELNAAGVPLYAITNFAKEKWALTTKRFPFLTGSFRDVVVSGHEGVVKPDAEIFKRLLKRNNLMLRQPIQRFVKIIFVKLGNSQYLGYGMLFGPAYRREP